MNTVSRQWISALVASAALVAGAGFGLSAQASPRGDRHDAGGMMWMGRGMDRMLESVNATEAQRTQIRQIAEAARADMKSQHEAGRALREQGRALFTQPTVDANAAEALRQQMLAQHDRSSQRTMQAMIDISRVLSPEQRQQIAQRMHERGDMTKRHQRERRSLDRPTR